MSNLFNQTVYDVDHNFGNDINLSGQNDLNPVSGLTRSQQRVSRRLLTNLLDYLWHIGYGAGLPGFIGEPDGGDLTNRIKARIQSQIFLEPSVSRVPAPVIKFENIPDGLFCQIDYTEYPSRESVVLYFKVG